MPRVSWIPRIPGDTFDISQLTGNKGDVFSAEKTEIQVSAAVAEHLETYPNENFQVIKTAEKSSSEASQGVEPPSDSARRANRG